MEDNLLYLKVQVCTKNKEDHKVVSETGFIFTGKKYFLTMKIGRIISPIALFSES